MSDLAERRCVPCRGGVPPLTGAELLPFAAQLPLWHTVEEHHISRTFLFPDFKSGLEFVNRCAELAEKEGHHPDLCLSWGKVEVSTYTHKAGGLTENDFILAAKIDRLFDTGLNQ